MIDQGVYYVDDLSLFSHMCSDEFGSEKKMLPQYDDPMEEEVNFFFFFFSS